MIELNRIYNEDCIRTLSRIDVGFIDLTITSPPYNVALNYDTIDDNLPYQEYLDWLKEIFELVYLKTKTGGRCVINIGDGINGRVSKHSDVIQLMKNIGWLTSATIIWEKMNSVNNCAWGTYNSPRNPSFVSSFEYILVFCKEQYAMNYIGETDLDKKNFIQWANGIWKFPGIRRKESMHPAAFPIELPLRCMKMLSWKNSIIYDPFMGSGATAIACKLTGRNWIGSEVSEDYCKIAQKRLEHTIIHKNTGNYF